MLEKALQRGITEFARGELKTKLKKRLKKRENTRYLILRYAAILFIAVITPLLIYYQFSVNESAYFELTPYPDDYSTGEKADSVYSVSPLPPAPPPPPEKSDKKTTVSRMNQRTATQPRIETETVTGPGAAASEVEDGTAAKPAVSNEVKQRAARAAVEREEKMADGLAEKSELPVLTDMMTAQKMPSVASAPTGTADSPLSKIHRILDQKIHEENKQLKECMEEFLSGPELNDYRAEISLNIGKTGSVRNVKITDSSTHSEKLEHCLIQLMENWTFEADSVERFVKTTIIYRTE
jgi:hypothetical protein